MRKLLKNVSLAMVLIGAAAIPALANDDHHDKDKENLKLDEVQGQAKAQIEKQVGKDGAIEDIEREHRDGKIVYEVEFRDKGGQQYEIVVSDTGKLLSKRRDS
jgi:uncharacterized membrane protein YkoI